jgi:hypothetical protein
MPFLRNITSGLRSLFRKEQVDRELDEELRAYQDMAAEEKMKDGMSPKDALRAVRLEQGNVESTREEVRSAGWESVLAGRTCALACERCASPQGLPPLLWLHWRWASAQTTTATLAPKLD